MNFRIYLVLIAFGFATSALAQGTKSYGKIHHYSDDEEHGIKVTIPANAPSISADYKSYRRADGELRAKSGRIDPVNHGVTITLNEGDEVLSVAPGRTVSSGYSKRGGHWVAVVSDIPKKIVLYFHLREVLVEKGDIVKRGQPIGSVGTGQHTNVPHLSFHVKEFGTPRGKGQVNPHRHWIGGDGKIECFDANKVYKNSDIHFMTYPVKCN